MSSICVCITNPMRKDEKGRLLGEWVSLPLNDDEIREVLSLIGIDGEHQDFIISDAELQNFDFEIGPHTDFYELNELAKKIDGLDVFEDVKLAALLEWEPRTTFAEISDAIDELDHYEFISEVYNDTDLGEYYIHEIGMFDTLPERLRYYVDAERYGRDIRYESDLYYSSFGVIMRNY